MAYANTVCYADVGELQGYLTSLGYGSASYASDTALLLRTLESVSRRMEQGIGAGSRMWHPHLASKVFDLGIGPLRNNQAVGGYSTAAPSLFAGAVRGQTLAYEINGYLSIGAAGLLPLDDWLIDDGTQTVSAWTTSDHTLLQLLGEGIGVDYLLEPYNESPKFQLKMYELTSKLLYAGQQTVQISGTWGWQNIVQSAGPLGAAITDTTGASVTLASGAAISAGDVILIGSEQLYVRAFASNVATVLRGVNGTTAATHLNGAGVSTYVYPSDLVAVALSLALVRLRRDDVAGGGSAMAEGMLSHGSHALSHLDLEDAILLDLDFYRSRREGAGVYF